LLGWVFVNGVFRVAVPTFLVINGYFFFDVAQRKADVFRWLRRILALYVFWMVVFSPVWGQDVSSVAKIIQLTLFGWFHLWYIAGLIVAGPLLYFMRGLGERKLLAAAVVLFTAGVVLQYLATFHVFDGLIGKVLEWNGSHRNFLMFSLPFLVFGYLLRKWEVQGLKIAGVRMMLVCALTALLLESLIVYFLTGVSEPTAVSRGSVDNYFSLLFVAPLLFLAAKKVEYYKDGAEGKRLAQLANGIYFTHPIFLVWIGFGNVLPATPATFLVIMCSTALTMLITQVPRLARWIL
jgi:surface polysaccharide O-acyltransferase-like enzyme